MILKSVFNSGLVLDVPPLYKVVMVVSTLTTMSSMYIWRYSNYNSRLILIFLESEMIFKLISFHYRVIYNFSRRSKPTIQTHHGRSGRYTDIILWSLGLLPSGYGGRPEDRAMQALPQVVHAQQGVD
jgi:hypothetical protein